MADATVNYANVERLSAGDLMQLKRWNTPSIFNGWERITHADPLADRFNIEDTRDFMPQSPAGFRAVAARNPAYERVVRALHPIAAGPEIRPEIPKSTEYA